MSRRQIGPITIGYEDEGDGAPLVLVHGHPFSRAMWRPQVEHFGTTGWRVIAPDLRGYGESTVVPGVTPLEVFARDVAALLDALSVGRVVLCGLSMGGQIAMEFQRLFPDRVGGLVLADTSARAETEQGRRDRRDLADRLVAEGMDRYAEQTLPMMVALRHAGPESSAAAQTLAMMRATDPEGAAAALRGRAERRDYLSVLPEVAVPTLVVVGDSDEFTPLPEAELIHRLVPGSALAVIERAGHLPNLERPADFNAALKRFLDSLGGVSGRG